MGMRNLSIRKPEEQRYFIDTNNRFWIEPIGHGIYHLEGDPYCQYCDNSGQAR